jgi:hypothetical protein
MNNLLVISGSSVEISSHIIQLQRKENKKRKEIILIF